MRVFFSAAISLGLILLGVWIGSFVFSVPNPAIADQEATAVAEESPTATPPPSEAAIRQS